MTVRVAIGSSIEHECATIRTTSISTSVSDDLLSAVRTTANVVSNSSSLKDLLTSYTVQPTESPVIANDSPSALKPTTSLEVANLSSSSISSSIATDLSQTIS